ncbi:MAG: hypothetical protein MJY89_00010 [Bacteroidales bacterium]|nr:hypothetical protein [Bacteroidales bacterium]
MKIEYKTPEVKVVTLKTRSASCTLTYTSGTEYIDYSEAEGYEEELD